MFNIIQPIYKVLSIDSKRNGVIKSDYTFLLS